MTFNRTRQGVSCVRSAAGQRLGTASGILQTKAYLSDLVSVCFAALCKELLHVHDHRSRRLQRDGSRPTTVARQKGVVSMPSVPGQKRNCSSEAYARHKRIGLPKKSRTLAAGACSSAAPPSGCLELDGSERWAAAGGGGCSTCWVGSVLCLGGEGSSLLGWLRSWSGFLEPSLDSRPNPAPLPSFLNQSLSCFCIFRVRCQDIGSLGCACRGRQEFEAGVTVSV